MYERYNSCILFCLQTWTALLFCGTQSTMSNGIRFYTESQAFHNSRLALHHSTNHSSAYGYKGRENDLRQFHNRQLQYELRYWLCALSAYFWIQEDFTETSPWKKARYFQALRTFLQHPWMVHTQMSVVSVNFSSLCVRFS